MSNYKKVIDRYPNEEVGQLPMAFIVRHNGSTIDEPQIMDFIAKQVQIYYQISLFD